MSAERNLIKTHITDIICLAAESIDYMKQCVQCKQCPPPPSTYLQQVSQREGDARGACFGSVGPPEDRSLLPLVGGASATGLEPARGVGPSQPQRVIVSRGEDCFWLFSLRRVSQGCFIAIYM